MRHPTTRFFAALSGLFLTACAAGAADITVTGIRLRPAERLRPALAEITLNGAITVKEVEVRTAGGRLDLKFPDYVSRGGRVFPQVRVLTRQARDAVNAAVASREPSKNAYEPLSFAVTAWKPLNGKSKTKAICTVTFNAAVAIECKIIESAHGYWVAWPARRPSGGGKWINQVVFLDRDLKAAVSDEVLRRYHRSQDKSS